MPYLSIDASATDALPLPSDGTYVVQMKRLASYGDQLEAQQAMLHISADAATAGISDMEWGAYIRTLICRLTASWNLTDAAGVLLPIVPASIDLLNQEDGAFLTAEAQKRVGGRPAAAQANFTSPSSTSSSVVTETPSLDSEQTQKPSES